MTPRMNLYKGKRLLTRKKYMMNQIALGLYTIVWFGVWVYTLFLWHSLIWYYKIILFILLLFLAPSLGDLTESYNSYKKEWEEVNLDTKTNEKRAG